MGRGRVRARAGACGRFGPGGRCRFVRLRSGREEGGRRREEGGGRRRREEGGGRREEGGGRREGGGRGEGGGREREGGGIQRGGGGIQHCCIFEYLLALNFHVLVFVGFDGRFDKVLLEL